MRRAAIKKQDLIYLQAKPLMLMISLAITQNCLLTVLVASSIIQKILIIKK